MIGEVAKLPLIAVVYGVLLLVLGLGTSLYLLRLDHRSAHLDLTGLRLFLLGGLCWWWLRLTLGVSAGGIPRVPVTAGVVTGDLGRFPPMPHLSDLLPSPALFELGAALLPTALLYLMRRERGGFGGGDLRYLMGLACWLPFTLYYRAVLLACGLHLVRQGVGAVRDRGHVPEAPTRYLRHAFLPSLVPASCFTVVISLLE